MNKNSYEEFRNREQKRFDEFSEKHMFYAFSEKRLAEGMRARGLDPDKDRDKITTSGAGAFFLKEDASKVVEMMRSFSTNLKEQIESDTTGEGFIFDMFNYELSNHEYCVTYDLEDTLDALNLTIEQINASEALTRGLNKALEIY